jgi:hypothetical protein
MEKLHTGRLVLRRFGMTMASALLIISGLLYLRHQYVNAVYTTVVSCGVFVAALAFPIILKPVYISWMKFTSIVGWVNTRIILVVLFYLVLVPLGLALRLLKIDLLERRNKEGTYWKEKDKTDVGLLRYERRF